MQVNEFKISYLIVRVVNILEVVILFKELMESGSELTVISKQVVSQQKIILPGIISTNCFKEEKTVDLVQFMISLENSEPLDIVVATCEELRSSCS